LNPYSPPSTAPFPGPPAGYVDPNQGAVVTSAVVEPLRQTRPWALLFSVLCFAASGFMMLASTAVVLAGSSFGARKGAPPSALGLAYVPIALVYIYPGLKLWAYASAIGRLVVSRSAADLESALVQQKSFWKYSGIAAVALVMLYAVGMLAFLAIWQFLAPTKH
jgi:hypothetical protein